MSPRPRLWCPRSPTRRCRADAVYFGEVSLSGAVRPVAQAGPGSRKRKSSAFTRRSLPEAARAEAPDGFSRFTIGTLANLVVDIARDGTPASRRVASGGLTRDLDEVNRLRYISSQIITAAWLLSAREGG